MRTRITTLLSCMLFLLLSEFGSAQQWSQLQKIASSDRSTSDYFGKSVVISGNHAIVGVPDQDYDAAGLNFLSNAGAAYIFQLSGGTWTQMQKLVASDRADSDIFGISVAISGNYAAVGAPDEDEDADGLNTLTSSGSVYVYELSGGTWTQVQKLVLPNRTATDYFGYSLTMEGTTLVISATGEDEDADELNPVATAGAVFVYERTGGVWVFVQKLVASDRTTYDSFGSAVAISNTSLVVGASDNDTDADGLNLSSNTGSAYVFELSGGIWAETQKIVASDRTSSDIFGYAIDIDGNHIIAGAYRNGTDENGNNPLGNAGAAYIFQLSGGVWTQSQKLVFSGRAVNDNFGYSVGISGNNAVVGIPRENLTGAASAAYGNASVFRLSGGVWSNVQNLGTTSIGTRSYFGTSVSIDGNYLMGGAKEAKYDANNVSLLRGGAALVFSLGDTWDGTSDTDWNNNSNWNYGVVPSSSAPVFISATAPNQPHIMANPASPQIVGGITIEAAANLTVDAGKALTVTENISNSGSILVKADATGIGSLITQGTVTGSGSCKMEQYLTGSNNAGTPNGVFYYVGSPVVGATAASYDIASGNKLWSADESTQSYGQITVGTTELNAGEGYVARMGTTDVFTHIGTSFNTGNQSITGLDRTGTDAANRGYNLVSNPYPSSLNWNNVDTTNLFGTVWYRTHNASNVMTYDTYNAVAGTGTSNNYRGTAATGIIPPTQGFWVRVKNDESTATLSFTNAMRSHGTLSGIYKTEAEEGTIRMTLSNETISDEAILLFNQDATDEFDAYDSHKFWAAATVPQLYMNETEDSLVINGLYSTATNPIVDLGVKLPTSGNYTINANEITVVGETVFLEDRLLNIFQDLNVEPNYSFSSTSGNIGDRFALHFGMSITGIGTDAINRVSTWVYTSNENTLNIILLENTESGKVQVLDMAGRIVSSFNVNSTKTSLDMNANAGVYLIRVETSKGIDTHRIMLN